MDNCESGIEVFGEFEIEIRIGIWG